MLLVVGEFLLGCLIVMGSIMLRKGHPKIGDGLFLAYVAFVFINYFTVRWRHEGLKRKVMKFKKWRRKVSTFDFGLPNPAGTPSSSSSASPPDPKTAPKKGK